MRVFVSYRLLPLSSSEERERLVDALLDGGYYRLSAKPNWFVPGVTLSALLGFNYLNTFFIVTRYGKGYGVFKKTPSGRERVTLLPVLQFR